VLKAQQGGGAWEWGAGAAASEELGSWCGVWMCRWEWRRWLGACSASQNWQGPCLPRQLTPRPPSRSRSSVWQWVRYGVTLDDGQPLTVDRVNLAIQEELDALRKQAGGGPACAAGWWWWEAALLQAAAASWAPPSHASVLRPDSLCVEVLGEVREPCCNPRWPISHLAAGGQRSVCHRPVPGRRLPVQADGDQHGAAGGCGWWRCVVLCVCVCVVVVCVGGGEGGVTQRGAAPSIRACDWCAACATPAASQHQPPAPRPVPRRTS
jgi:hypothetical protein